MLEAHDFQQFQVMGPAIQRHDSWSAGHDEDYTWSRVISVLGGLET